LAEGNDEAEMTERIIMANHERILQMDNSWFLVYH